MQNTTSRKDTESSHLNPRGVGGPVRVTLNSGEKLTFIHTPKTAGISIIDWMYGIPEAKEYSKIFTHCGFELTKEHFDGDLGTSFAVVRNPWELYVSFWFYDVMRKDSKYKDCTFSEWFLMNLEGIVFIQQSRFYQGCDFVLRYENLIEEFKAIQELVGHYAPLDKKNFLGDRKHYSRFYEGRDDIVREIAIRQKDVINDFGYEFEVK